MRIGVFEDVSVSGQTHLQVWISPESSRGVQIARGWQTLLLCGNKKVGTRVLDNGLIKL